MDPFIGFLFLIAGAIVLWKLLASGDKGKVLLGLGLVVLLFFASMPYWPRY